ncbi:unnamed protein product [Arabidopsis halleri]
MSKQKSFLLINSLRNQWSGIYQKPCFIENIIAKKLFRL